MTARVNLGKASPPSYEAVLGLEKLASAAMDEAGFSRAFSHLLKLRASQINECAYCVRMHAKDALATGASADLVAVVAAWRETTGYFSPKERAALSLAEAITTIADGQVPDAVYDAAVSELSAQEIAAVEWAAIVINVWNRIAIASRYNVAP